MAIDSRGFDSTSSRFGTTAKRSPHVPTFANAPALFAATILSFEAQVPLMKLGTILALLAASEIIPYPATLRAEQAGILALEGEARPALLCRMSFVLEARLPARMRIDQRLRLRGKLKIRFFGLCVTFKT
jgi:hypothetical protein